ncbi:MAG: hypothetical protein R3D59_12030 [Paracoccaceae bacterium]
MLVDVNGSPARLLACFEEVMMPATVLVEHELVVPERRQYVKRRDGTLELVEYPARYRQIRTVLEPAYVELRQIPCRKREKVLRLVLARGSIPRGRQVRRAIRPCLVGSLQDLGEQLRLSGALALR